MNRKERDELARAVIAQILPKLKNSPAPPESGFNNFVRTWGNLITPALAIIAFVYWQFVFDLDKRIDDRIADSKSVKDLGHRLDNIDLQLTKLSDNMGDFNTRLSRLEGQVSRIASRSINERLASVTNLPSPRFALALPEVVSILTEAGASGATIDPPSQTACVPN
jgi:hypothetical protein